MWVETISRKDLYDLERVINIEIADLTKREYEIVDIKYSCMVYHMPYEVKKEYTAMIIYKEGVKNE